MSLTVFCMNLEIDLSVGDGGGGNGNENGKSDTLLSPSEFGLGEDLMALRTTEVQYEPSLSSKSI